MFGIFWKKNKNYDDYDYDSDENINIETESQSIYDIESASYLKKKDQINDFGKSKSTLPNLKIDTKMDIKTIPSLNNIVNNELKKQLSETSLNSSNNLSVGTPVITPVSTPVNKRNNSTDSNSSANLVSLNNNLISNPFKNNKSNIEIEENAVDFLIIK